jgi:hypothetical protein
MIEREASSLRPTNQTDNLLVVYYCIELHVSGVLNVDHATQERLTE